MSRENVELVRKMWEPWVSGDRAALSFLDLDVTYEDNILPDHAGETYHGHDGLLRAWARAVEPWEGGGENHLEWARDAGGAVVSCHRTRSRGKGSGMDIEFRYAYVWRFRGGKVIYVKSYASPAEALEAVGLRE